MVTISNYPVVNTIDSLRKQVEDQKAYIQKLELRIKQLEKTLHGIRRVR